MRHLVMALAISGSACATEPTPPPAPTLAGFVTDSLSGAAIAGARVRVEVYAGYPVDSTLSAADGSYRLAVPAVCCAQISAFASFYPRRDYGPMTVSGNLVLDIRLLHATPYDRAR